MKFVLIVTLMWLPSAGKTPSPFTVGYSAEFDDYEACEVVARRVNDVFMEIRQMPAVIHCFPKGSGPATPETKK